MIIADSRESRSDIKDLLEKMGVPVTQAELEVGDYAISNVVIERKEVNDYLSSLFDGRLNNGLYQMSCNYPLSYLLVEGNMMQALMDKGISRDLYISSLVGSSLKRAPIGEQGQIITVNLDTKYDTALFLKKLWEKLQKDEPRLPKLAKKSVDDNEMLVYSLGSISGIGEKKARSLLEECGTLRNVMNSNEIELKRANGIGDTLANRMFKLFNKKYEVI
jgi:ERCC4-type nuclease